MFNKIFYFIKYNNAAVIILAIILILGAGVFAAGPDAIGQKQTQIKGIDNVLLLSADLDNFNMDFKIQNIEQDNKYYYIDYSYLDLVVIKQAWQYQLSQKTVKVSKKINEDIGIYMARYLTKHYEARIRELKQEKSQALINGKQERFEVTEYTGLVGKTLDLVAEVFPKYEPIKKVEMPTPETFTLPPSSIADGENKALSSDNLTQVYNDYIAEHDLNNSGNQTITTPSIDNQATTTTLNLDNNDTATSNVVDQANVEIIKSPVVESKIELKSETGDKTTSTEPAVIEPAAAEPATTTEL
ncbi:MAG: hypothetical protein AAB653_00195 [Patescibacteria group bacterium]|mgnify:CR=1 FL=1